MYLKVQKDVKRCSFLYTNKKSFQVFGAYCSSTWATRNEKDDQGNRQQYFGTGESFLFSFSQGSPSKYPWVNAENNGEG